ncbi:MAG: FliA/WhiG family RNA polymerase sigma factor [Clostridia bacterium]|nr:FliA/WhiG family RNA polymerase sigma factor [Clostridia bacterium]MDR3645354.1 FliA/WhiG family RNA polymerase sigma factor [Clostridia bacterium]
MTMVTEGIETAELWRLYVESRDIELRNELILRYSGLVGSIVRRIAAVSGNYADTEDLQSYGMLGLIKAIEKYDPGRGAAFETFAVYRVRGEVIDYIRRNDWVPRGVRKRAQEFDVTVSTLTNELGRRPQEDELAGRLGLERSELHQLYTDIERFNTVSFEELLQGTLQIGDDFADTKTPEGSVQEHELIETLSAAIEEMPERERLIITLYYYEELSLKEISGVLGVSESRVSQLHSRAISRMKKILTSYLNL